MTLHRRQFLHSTAALTLATASARLWAAPNATLEPGRPLEADTPRLLMVFLRGAYDCCSALVPGSSDFYKASRPNIALDPAVLHPLSPQWGLNPAIRDSLLPWLKQRELAFVPYIGIPGTTRSHFDSQDRLELGLDGTETLNSRGLGWMTRLARQMAKTPKATVQPIAFTQTRPLIFQGPDSLPNFPLQKVSAQALPDALRTALDDMYGTRTAPRKSGTDLTGTLGRNLDLGLGLEAQNLQDEQQEAQAQKMHAQPADRKAVTTKGFVADAGTVARMMRRHFNLGFVDIGGWDTHVGQGNVTGTLTNRLTELAQGLSVYASQMQDAWPSTTVIVVSEFGRTFRENGSRGTDHGYGSTYWLMGGGLDTDPVIGLKNDHVLADASALNEDRDLPIFTDYRVWLRDITRQRLGVSWA